MDERFAEGRVLKVDVLFDVQVVVDPLLVLLPLFVNCQGAFSFGTLEYLFNSLLGIPPVLDVQIDL